jgi:hypothetical protein
MAQAPYDEADTLDLMRADAGFALGAVTHDSPEVPNAEQGLHVLRPTAGVEVEVPPDAADLGGALHFHLD